MIHQPIPKHPAFDAIARLVIAAAFFFGAYHFGPGTWLGLLMAAGFLIYVWGTGDSALWVWTQWKTKKDIEKIRRKRDEQSENGSSK